MTTSIFRETDSIATLPLWKPATWEDYLRERDDPTTERVRLYFYRELLLIEMGSEGINHSSVNELLKMLFAFWLAQNPELKLSLFGGTQLEKPQQKAAAPDIILYVGEDYPRWHPGERRFIDLDKWRVPDLVGEVADTTLATDLDEKKKLYASLEIPEYWVVDVRGLRIFVFALQEEGQYSERTNSLILEGLPISLLEQTLRRLNEETNGSAALWFSQQIGKMKSS